MSLSLPISRYPDQPRVLTFFRRAGAALAAIPGVQSVGFVDNLPLDGWDIGMPVEIAGDPPTDAASRKSAHYQITSPGYFETSASSSRQDARSPIAMSQPRRRSASSTKSSSAGSSEVASRWERLSACRIWRRDSRRRWHAKSSA